MPKSKVGPYEIYLITTPGYWYVGSSTKKAAFRFKQHMSGQGKAPKLWAKIQDRGKDSFQQVVVERGVGDPIEAEQKWYDFYSTHDARESLNGKRPGGWDGYVPSEEDRENTRQRALGNTYSVGLKRSPETRAKISEAHKGRTMTPEWRAKIGAAGMGRVDSPETTEKRRQSGLGRTHSSETKEKIRQSHLGKKMSPENVEKLS